MKSTYVLVMEFVDAEDCKRTIRVPNPREGLTAEEVQEVMNFFGDNVIFEKWAYPARVKGAKIVATTTETLEITVS